MLESFWGEATAHGLDLPRAEPVSAQAFCQARRKLPSSIVRSLLHLAGGEFDEVHGERFRWRGCRLLAVDGAWRRVRRSDELVRLGVPDRSHYPQCHLTTLFDVKARLPLDAAVGPFGSNERVQLAKVLERTRKGDVLVLDRGYPSFDVFVMLRESGLDFVARVLTSGTFKEVEAFVDSGATRAHIELAPTQNSVLRGLDPIPMRILRVPRRGGPPWILVTALPEAEFPDDAIAQANALRWEVEEFYKLMIVDYFDPSMFHAIRLGGVEQELYAHLLFVAITRHLMATVSRDADVPYEGLSQKGAMMAFGDHLTRLVLAAPRASAIRAPKLLLERIAAARYKPRPGRSHPRRSFSPPSPWGRKGRVRGG